VGRGGSPADKVILIGIPVALVVVGTNIAGFIPH